MTIIASQLIPVSNIDGWPGAWLIQIQPGEYLRQGGKTGSMLHFPTQKLAAEWLAGDEVGRVLAEHKRLTAVK
jgi:hypothetical protein